MGNILSKKSGRINVETYCAIQTGKCCFCENAARANGTKSFPSFQREDKLHSHLMPSICRSMRDARCRYKKALAEKKKKKTIWEKQQVQE